jgi:hypothetical protein
MVFELQDGSKILFCNQDCFNEADLHEKNWNSKVESENPAIKRYKQERKSDVRAWDEEELISQ